MYKLNTKIWLAGLTSLLLLAGQVQDSFASSLKKGVGSNSAARVQALNASWYYNWNIALNAGHDPATEYVAMRHNRWWQSLAELANVGTIHYLLGFNEPERPPPQGDTTVAQAIALWPDLETAAATYGLELGSPVPANANHPWLTNFMNQASTLGLQVDFMTMHKYPRPNNPQAVLNDAAWLNSTYGRDVWVTEFNAADWDGNNEFTHGESYTFMIEVLFQLESTSYIKRYAVFPWDGSTEASSASAIFEPGTDNLTPLGKLYANYHSGDVNGPFTETWYHLHNKGSHQRLHDNAATPAMADVYTEGNTVEFKLSDTGDNDYFIVNRGTGERLGYNGTQLFWTATITDDSVQWEVLDDTNGWKKVAHAGISEYLRVNGGTLTMGTQTDDTTRWAFARASTTNDVDGDGHIDTADNCTYISNPAQVDTDADGHGNICDGDFNNDCAVNFFDLTDFKLGFGGADPELDLDSDGSINFFDLAIFKGLFGNMPGPSGSGALCP